jgi:hypothetical protein
VCDIACQLEVHVQDGEVLKVAPPSNPVVADNFCFKGVTAPKLYTLPDRLKTPLRRVGERGSGQREGGLAGGRDDRHRRPADARRRRARPRGVRGLDLQLEHERGDGDGPGRRFMNLLGFPNWISGVAMWPPRTRRGRRGPGLAHGPPTARRGTRHDA